MTEENVVAPVQEVTQEVVENEQPVQEDKVNIWDKRLETLTSQERRLVKERQALKAQQESLKKYETLQSLVKENPAQALSELGLSWDDLVSYQLKQAEQETIDPTVKKLDLLEKELSEFKSKQSQDEKSRLEAEQQQLISQAKVGLENHYNQAKENFPYLELVADQLSDTLFETAQEIYNVTGKMPSPNEVCEVLNSTLQEEAQKYAKFFAPKESSVPPATEAQAQKPNLGQTLTSGNSNVQTNSKPGSLTKEERRARAMQYL